MSTQALMVRDELRQLAEYTPAGIDLKENALASSALIAKVGSDIEQEEAVSAQRGLRAVIKLAEEARKACKEPVIEFGRRIDDVAKSFKAELEREELRIAKLVGDYQTAQLAKAKAAEALQAKALSDLERERQEALASAHDHEERDRINADYDEQAKAKAPGVEVAQARGQIVREQWVIRTINEFVLAKARPDLVRKIEFDTIAIKALLNAGEKLPGVVAEKEITSTVRAGRAEVINV